MANVFFPPLSTIITTDTIPEELNFVTNGINSLLEKVHYKDFLVDRSLNGASISYRLDLISNSEILKIEIPGTELVLSLNPDLDDPNVNYSVIPIALTWRWGLQQYIKDFKINSFSFQPDAFYNLIFKITEVSDRSLLLSALNTFIEETNPLNKFVVDANTKYTDLNIPYPLNSDQEIAMSETLTAIDQHQSLTLYDILLQDYIIDTNLDNSLKNIDQLFFPILGYDTIENIKDLIIPKISASLKLSAGLEIPRSVLIPVKANGEVEEDESIKTVLLFEAGELVFNSKGGFGFEEMLAVSFPASHPKAQIGNTGIRIGFTHARLDMSRNSNILQSYSAGYSADFVGLYVQEATIEFTRFGQDNSSKTSIGIIGRDLLIGTGGFSGTIGLAAEGVLYRKFGGLSVELNQFAINFRQNAITGSAISGKLTIPGFTKNGEAAVIDIEAAIKDNGDFIITALPQPDLFKITLPNVLELEIRSISMGTRNDRYFLAVSGRIDFIADIPVLGQILPKEIEIHKLLIWDNGDLEFEGGSIPVPKAFKLKVGPVKLEVVKISLGAYPKLKNGVERKYHYFGFDGMINTGRAGINATGNGIKYYFTKDNNGVDKTFDHFISIDGIAIDLTIPGNVPKDSAAFLLNGYLSMRTPNPLLPNSQAATEYTGAVAFSIPKLRLSGSAGMRLQPDIPAFVVDIGLELANPVPIGGTGLGIYGFRGLIGQHYMPTKSATTPPLPETASWWEYYKTPSIITGREGIELDKFANRSGLAVGAGASIATSFDSGKVFSSKLFLLLGLPDVFLIQGQAAILRERIGLKDDVDPPFSALIVIGDKSFRGNLGVNYNLPDKGDAKGAILSLQGNLDLAFFFNNASGWYLNIGKDTPESERVRAKILTLFQGHAYLMLSSRGIKAGAGAKFDFKEKFGPVSVGLGAYLNLGGFVSFRPVQIGGFIQVGGYAYVKIFKFGINIYVDAKLAVEAPRPFNICGSFEINIKLGPFKVKVRLALCWKFNDDNSALLAPIPILELPSPERGYLPAAAINIHTHESFQINYVTSDNPVEIPAPGASGWKYSFITAEEALEVTIPLDSFIDIELLKPVKPANNLLGGASNQLPDGYIELLPPKKGLSEQVRHEFELTDLEIFVWKADGINNSWVPYNIYEAVTAIVEKNTGANFVDLQTLKPGYWQFIEPNRYNKIRLMSQHMFSYTSDASSTQDLDNNNFARKDVFCFDSIRKEFIIDWRLEQLNTLYPAGSYTFKNTQFLFEDLNASIKFEPAYTAKSLYLDGVKGTATIKFPEPVSLVNLRFGATTSAIEVSFGRTSYLGLLSGITTPSFEPSEIRYLSKDQQNATLTYESATESIDTILLQFNVNPVQDYTGDLVIGGHYSLPQQYIPAELSETLIGEIDLDKAIIFVTYYNRSLSREEVISNSLSDNQPGIVGKWTLSSVNDINGNLNGVLNGNPDLLPGYHSSNNSLAATQVYEFTSNADAFVVPFKPALKVENSSFSFELTAIFNPFNQGIITLLSKVQEDALTGSKRGYALHLGQFTPGNPATVYSAVSEVPSYKIFLTVYNGLNTWTAEADDIYTMNCDGFIKEVQYKNIVVSVNRSTSKIDIYVDKINQLNTNIPNGLAPYDNSIKATFLNEIGYVTQDHYQRLTDNQITEAKVIDEVQILDSNINKVIQPVWRPEATYAIRLKTQDRVNGNPTAERTHVFGFKTAGPLGHFHQQNKKFKELEQQDRQDEFKLSGLKYYIDYERSFPDANGRYDLSKPVFCSDPQVKLFFTKPYINSIYSDWGIYQGLAPLESRLELELIDPFGEIILREVDWQPTEEIIITGSDARSLPEDLNRIFLLNQAASQGVCNPMPAIKKRIQKGVYTFPDLEPNKLYTAVFNAFYKPGGLNAQKSEVHKFSFKTSRYNNFVEQVSSYILNDTVGSEEYAIYVHNTSFSNDYISNTLNLLHNTDMDDDPENVLQYAVKFDRLLFGGLKIKNLESGDRTVVTLVVNTNPADSSDQRVLGILLGNPEPFNDPKLPSEVINGTVNLKVTLLNNSVVQGNQFTYIHSRDNSAVFITNAGLSMPLGNFELDFYYKIFDGLTYITDQEYHSPSINIFPYLSV